MELLKREVKTTIQVLCKQLQGFKESWCKHLPSVEFSLNAKTQPHFQFSPFTLMYMRVPLVPFLKANNEVDSSSFSVSEAVDRLCFFQNHLCEHFESQISRATRSADRFSKTKRIVNPLKYSLLVIMFTKLITTTTFKT